MLMACAGGHVGVCQWLWDHGATADDATRPGHDGCSPMHMACDGGHIGVCQWLWDHGVGAEHMTRSDNFFLETPMLVACRKGHIDVCQWLWEHGATTNDVKTPDKSGCTPLFRACSGGHVDMSQWLLDHGATVTPHSLGCYTARSFYQLASKTSQRVFRFLRRGPRSH